MLKNCCKKRNTDLVDIGNELNFAENHKRAIVAQRVEYFLSRYIAQTPGVAAFGRLGVEVTDVHIAKSSRIGVVHKVEAVFGFEQHLKTQDYF